jgi:hypothetical protein
MLTTSILDFTLPMMDIAEIQKKKEKEEEEEEHHLHYHHI